ncbi:MAG: pre-16S rRNA-processing nuclease YqgF [Spirulinaceae cyanobacterium]
MINDKCLIILGFDPGKDKCGVAVKKQDSELLYHQVVASPEAITSINGLCQKYGVKLLVMGNQTTSKQWKQKLEEKLTAKISILMVDERYSTLEARDRYWEMYPPQGLKRLIPQGMRLPPRPVDDIVAILLIERYCQSQREAEQR